MRKLLLRLNAEKKITIVISSHILSELENLVTEYGFINNGKLVKQISSKELEDECTKYLAIKVTQPEKMTALLEQKMGCSSIKIAPDQTICLYDHLNEPNQVSQLAIDNGIGLLGLTLAESNLEDYFIELVGGEEHA